MQHNTDIAIDNILTEGSVCLLRLPPVTGTSLSHLPVPFLSSVWVVGCLFLFLFSVATSNIVFQ